MSESESGDPEEYAQIAFLLSDKAKALVAMKRKALQRRVRCVKAKVIANQTLLAHSKNHKVRTIVDEFPDIGKQVESFRSG